MAEQVTISQIQATSLPAPLKARVIRKWVMYKRRKWGSYLLIDNHGDTIHALYRLADEAHLESQIVLMGCYVFDDYVCQNAPTIMRVAAHTASIKIDSVTTITAADDDSAIPRRFFRFTPHEELALRMERIDVLTDYIGKVESIEHVETQFGNSLIRVTVQGLSGDPIAVALWREIAALVDLDALAATDKPVIAAFASVKVIDLHDEMQLESTAATRVEINPDIAVAHELAARLDLAGPTDAPRVTFTPPIVDRERRTLATDVEAGSSIAAAAASADLPVVTAAPIQPAAVVQKLLTPARAQTTTAQEQPLMLAPVTPAKTVSARRQQPHNNEATLATEEEDSSQGQAGSSSTKRSSGKSKDVTVGNKKAKTHAPN
ncbi:hypothetical protein SSX86_008224 [Deinandra increscens subsp. villosa]|uniref:Uncharacterized protein n=1 Tax=Deinandra increscens subsp. villosa TaxID=3103831 RepID=A0AAP0DEV6_9ASTR